MADDSPPPGDSWPHARDRYPRIIIVCMAITAVLFAVIISMVTLEILLRAETVRPMLESPAATGENGDAEAESLTLPF